MRFFINVKQWNDKVLYSSPINGKNADGTECCYFLNVRFVKCTPPTKNVNINVDYGFMSAFKKQDGTVVPELVALKWSEIERKENTETATKVETSPQQAEPQSTKSVMIESDEDMPF